MKNNLADSHNDKGTVFAKQGKFAEAKIEYKKALECNPLNVRALSNLAGVHCVFSEHDEAAKLLSIAIGQEPKNADILNNLLRIYSEQTKIDEAAQIANKILQINPNHQDSLIVIGNHSIKTKQPAKAVEYLTLAYNNNPNDVNVLSWLVQSKLYCCDWRGIKPLLDKVTSTVKDSDADVIHPLDFTHFSNEAEEHFLCANKWWNKKIKPEVQEIKSKVGEFSFENRDMSKKKINLGYFSADFKIHAVSALVSEHIELHNKDEFKLYAYSFGEDDKSEARKRLMNVFDVFRDLKDVPDSQAAQAIYDDEIDILIDLAGHTSAPTAVAAARPAPIIVNWLGYPGTMGGDFADYIIADGTVISKEEEKFYSEKIIRMPNCYQPNDRKRKISDKEITKKDYDLPEDARVLCCFNGTQKLRPEIFDVWINILKKFPDTVLWLLHKKSVPENVYEYANAQGIDDSRIIFAKSVPMPEHIARYKFASLFLDTVPYNAHTTGSEALFMGCPVVTITGNSFPSKVGASLLKSVNMPELITDNLRDYEAKITDILSDSLELERLRARLKANLDNGAPLFNAPEFTSHFETALKQVWSQYKKEK